ncbi:MAG: hypothetical protein U1F43_15000 [Myxococcota bacterium]
MDDTGQTDTGTLPDSHQPDGDGTAPGAVGIVSFGSDFGTITRGPDRLGQPIEGSATLAWETENAASIQILVDGVPVSLDGCVPVGGGTCAAAGKLTVKPTHETTFVLRALGPDGECDGACPEQSVKVSVAVPAIVDLQSHETIVAAGGEASATYHAMATTWSIGLTTVGPDDTRTFVPCVAASQAGADAPCILPDDGAGNVLAEGDVRIEAIERDSTIAVMATNGADDHLGDIALGDLLLAIRVPVDVRSFTVTPAEVLPGGSVVLAWEVSGAHTVEVTSPSGDVIGLSTCVGLGEDGKGFCTVTIDADAHLGAVVFTLTGEQDTGSTGEARVEIGVIGGPTIGAFDAMPAVVVPGQPMTLTWTAFGADAVSLAGSLDLVGAEDCTAIDAAGAGTCQVSVAAGTAAGPLTLTLTASHHAVGPPATQELPLLVLDAPAVTAAGLEDDTVLPGARVGLSWKTDHAAFVTVTEDSGAIAPSELASCSAVGGIDGFGSCIFQLPLEVQPGDIHLSVVAVGPTGARSEPETLTLAIGLAPTATFTASPLTLPQGGGDVGLSWTAASAAHVVVVDDGIVPITIVDSDEGTMCDGGQPCTPAAGLITVAAVQSSTYTLRAWNDFGETVKTASVALEGAPVITLLTLGGVDVHDQSVVIAGTSAELDWSVTELGASDEVRLERAPLPTPDGSCDAVTDWTLVSGFPLDGAADGNAMVDGLTATAECFRFVAEDKDATPTQRDTSVFKVRKAPSITSLQADDITVQTGDVVTLTWATKAAYGVALTVAPVGAVTSQELAGCTAASGSCAVTIQPGTPLGDVTFVLVARGEEQAKSDASHVAVTVGIGAKLDAFTVTPPSATAAVDVDLAWKSVGGTSLVITTAAGQVFTSQDALAIAAGDHAIAHVTATTTWTLVVANEFGSATGQVTVFIGPSIDALTVNGASGLDGTESIVTGPATVAWTTTSADGSQKLETTKAPANGNCATANLVWTKVYEAAPAPSASASASLGVVTDNLCVRLTVANSQTPPQSSSATFLLRELPEVVELSTSPAHIAAAGGTVIIDMGIRGATGLTLTAQYRDASGAVVGTRAVCNQGSLNNGTLTGGAAVDSVSCAHTIAACNLLCLNNGMPAGTKSVRYLLSVGDVEGDAASSTTAGGDDVTVQ